MHLRKLGLVLHNIAVELIFVFIGLLLVEIERQPIFVP